MTPLSGGCVQDDLHGVGSHTGGEEAIQIGDLRCSAGSGEILHVSGPFGENEPITNRLGPSSGGAVPAVAESARSRERH